MKDSNNVGPRLVTSAFKATRAVMQQSAKTRKAYTAAAAGSDVGGRGSQNIMSLHHQRMETFTDGAESHEQCIDYLLDAGPILRKYMDFVANRPPAVRTMSFGAPLGRRKSPSVDIKKLADEFQLKALRT